MNHPFAAQVPKGVLHATANAEDERSVHLAIGFAQRVPTIEGLRRRLAATNGSTFAPTLTPPPSPLPTPGPTAMPTGLRSRDELSCSESSYSKVCTSGCDHYETRCVKTDCRRLGSGSDDTGEETCDFCDAAECEGWADDLPVGSWAYCANDRDNPYGRDKDDNYCCDIYELTECDDGCTCEKNKKSRGVTTAGYVLIPLVLLALCCGGAGLAFHCMRTQNQGPDDVPPVQYPYGQGHPPNQPPAAYGQPAAAYAAQPQVVQGTVVKGVQMTPVAPAY